MGSPQTAPRGGVCVGGGAAVPRRLSVTDITFDGHTVLMCPNPVPAAIFAPTGVECGVDFGIVDVWAKLRVAFINASWRKI